MYSSSCLHLPHVFTTPQCLLCTCNWTTLYPLIIVLFCSSCIWTFGLVLHVCSHYVYLLIPILPPILLMYLCFVGSYSPSPSMLHIWDHPTYLTVHTGACVFCMLRPRLTVHGVALLPLVALFAGCIPPPFLPSNLYPVCVRPFNPSIPYPFACLTLCTLLLPSTIYPVTQPCVYTAAPTCAPFCSIVVARFDIGGVAFPLLPLPARRFLRYVTTVDPSPRHLYHYRI